MEIEKFEEVLNEFGFDKQGEGKHVANYICRKKYSKKTIVLVYFKPIDNICIYLAPTYEKGDISNKEILIECIEIRDSSDVRFILSRVPQINSRSEVLAM